MEGIRQRLGPMLQLHSWLASDEEVEAGMEELVQLIKSASGTLLTPPATKWKKSADQILDCDEERKKIIFLLTMFEQRASTLGFK